MSRVDGGELPRWGSLPVERYLIVSDYLTHGSHLLTC